MLGRVSFRALLAVGPLAVGCDFFQELKDADSAGDSGSSGGSDSGGGSGDAGAIEGPCTIARDDRCATQDLVATCDPATGEVAEIPCDALCGSNVNFTCVSTAARVHACWCIVPGKQKVYSCSELEDCISDCAQAGPCTDQCFARTNDTTARMYGGLVHCAEMGCDSLCREAPEACGPCIDDAIASGEGCSLPRAVCDADKNDEDWGYP